MTMQCSDVSKCLGCVGGIADVGNYIIFGSKGGIITPVAHTKIILPDYESLVTKFLRHGRVYRMDAWVRRQDVVPKQQRVQGHGK